MQETWFDPESPTLKPEVVHELSQSLLIVHAYAQSAIEHIKMNTLERDQLKWLLLKIDEQIKRMSEVIPHLVHV